MPIHAERGRRRAQIGVGAGVVVVAVALGVGASGFAADTGYAGVGPAFVPWIVTAVMAMAGILLIREGASAEGYRNYEPEPPPPEGVRWHAFAIASAGLLLNAALITVIGFTLSCALLFLLVACAFGSRRWLHNAAFGIATALPVYWMFHFGLGLTLPSLLKSGWI